MAPTLELDSDHALAVISGADLVWSQGNPAFHQTAAGNASSADPPISGRFTGPGAEELIGGIRLEHVSPVDGGRKIAVGAFIAKRD